MWSSASNRFATPAVYTPSRAAGQRLRIKAVAVKGPGQPAELALHRMPAQLVKMRAAQINGLRGLLTA